MRSARAFFATGVALVVMTIAVLIASPAGAHDVVQWSLPADGATLRAPPTNISVAFSERPDPSQSSIEVMDATGAVRGGGRPSPAAGEPSVLTIHVEGISNGTYTVRWRALDAVDGHLSSGSFSFGVNAPAAGTPIAARDAATGELSSQAVRARWVYFLGVMGLLGTAFVGSVVFWPPPAAVVRWGLIASWLLALGGCVGLVELQASATGVSALHLLSSPAGHSLMARAAPVFEAAVPIAVVLGWRGTARRLALVAVCVLVAMSMLADAQASHAATAASWTWVHVGVLWAHFAAVGVWLGGLVVVVACLPAIEPDRRAAGVGRYTAAAAVALLAVAATGALQAATEVGAWGRLLTTGFGRLILVKIGILGVLAALGAVNRYRNVPRVGRAPWFLHRVAVMELAVAAAALVATAVLQNLAPAAASATATAAGPAGRASKPLTVQGADAAGTTRAALTLERPSGTLDVIRVALTRATTGAVLDVDNVTLRLAMPDRPDIGGAELVLPRVRPGTYEGRAGLAVPGTWALTVIVRDGPSGTEVPLTLVEG